MVTRESILRDRLMVAVHNKGCYSQDILSRIPKEGCEEAYNDAVAEINILAEWLDELGMNKEDTNGNFV